MTMNLLGFANSVLASSSVSADFVATPCLDRKMASVSGASWHVYRRARLYSLLLVVLIAPSTISAVPLKAQFDYKHVLDSVGVYSLNRRDSNLSGGLPMSIWLPIIALAVVFMLFSLIICIRRVGRPEPPSSTSTGAPGIGTGNNGTAPRTRRRPQRTPSQISTKSLPPYMKEPGDQELVLFRGPADSEMADDHPHPGAMPTLAEEDEHPELQNTTFNISLNRFESYDTLVDGPTANVIRRPPELHHADRDVIPHRSTDSLGSAHSYGSSVELMGSHQRTISVDVADPRGNAPPYAEATMTTISLNDPEPNNISVARGASSTSANPVTTDLARSGSRSQVAQPRAPSPVIQPRSDSALSQASNESNTSSHSRTGSGNHSRSYSNSNILRHFRSHSKTPASSSTISLGSISAPLTHTVTRAEFRAPKGGLLTAEQIKLITSREALEKFRVPYGPDAVKAFSISMEHVAPPPDFDSVVGDYGQLGASGSGSTGTSSTSGEGPHLPSSASPSQQDIRSESRASTVMTYATAHESDEPLDEDQTLYLQAVQAYASDSETEEGDELLTARPATRSPTTARRSNPPWARDT